MSPIYGPAPSRMGGGGSGGCKPVHKFVCLSVCVCPYVCVGMGGWATGSLPMYPYLLWEGCYASQAILKPAGDKTAPVSLVMGVCAGSGGMDCGCRFGGGAFSACDTSFLCLWLTIAGGISQLAKEICSLPPGRVKHRPGTEYMCIELVHVWALFWCPYACVCMKKRKEKKPRFQPFRDMESDLLLWPLYPKQTVLFQSQGFQKAHRAECPTQSISNNNASVLTLFRQVYPKNPAK